MNKIAIVNKLTKNFQNISALENISFELERGQTLGIIGPNGAGKSTLINLLAGIYIPDSGSIKYFNEPFTTNSFFLKKKLGVLPNKLGMFEQLRGKEYLYFISRFYDINEENTLKNIDELFSFMEMKGEENKFIHQYSTGMKKKIAIAAVLIHTPDILILDEPFESIDPISMNKITTIIQKMAYNGSTIIVTSQILPTIEKLCTDILIINKGKEIVKDETKNIHLYANNINSHNNETLHLHELFINIMKENKRDTTLSFI